MLKGLVPTNPNRKDIDHSKGEGHYHAAYTDGHRRRNDGKSHPGKGSNTQVSAKSGFVEGAKVIVVSSLAGNVIVSVKDARVAISEQMASRIMV